MEYDPCTCRVCGQEFNLAYQLYYDNICPTCKKMNHNNDELEAEK